MCTKLEIPSFARNSPTSEEVANLLVDYLADDVDGDATRIAVALVTHMPSDPGTMTYDSWWVYLTYFWGIVYHLAKQISCDDVRHSKLVSVLLAISEQPPPANVPPEFDLYQGDKFWTDLPLWRAVWCDLEDVAPFRPSMEDREAMEPGGPLLAGEDTPWIGHRRFSRDEWTNLNAFQARFHAAIPHLRCGDVLGLYAHLEALEQDYRDVDALEDLVPAAACWIVYAGTTLKNDARYYAAYDTPDETDYTKRVPWSRGPLYKGQRCFNDEHWSFWKSRYISLLSRGDLSSGTKVMVSRALQKLEILGI